MKKTLLLEIVRTIIIGIALGLVINAMIVVLTGCSERPGPQGIPGQDAPPVTITMRPATSIECPTGGSVVGIGDQDVVVCNGLQGSTGATGNDGIDGIDGQTIIGPPGTPGTQVTIVNFCSHVTSYPSVFTEIGFCIEGNLFGVYSENNGFMTYIPPGNYASHGHGSTCTFTVGPNCAVYH